MTQLIEQRDETKQLERVMLVGFGVGLPRGGRMVDLSLLNKEVQKVSNVVVYEQSKIIGKENIVWGSNIIIDDFVFINAKRKISIGSYVHIGAFSSLSAVEEIIMEDFTGISHGCRLFTASDDFIDSGFGNPTIPEMYRNISSGPIIMGKFSIIGANSVVLPGVKIGEGATVAANSVVSKDLKPWGIYVGNNRIGYRNREGVMKNYEKFLQEKNKS